MFPLTSTIDTIKADLPPPPPHTHTLPKERERERESFWREPGTQQRTDAEKQELLAIFEDERRQASDNILALLPEVLGREKALSMVTSMEAAGAPPATPAELYRQTVSGMVDCGWIGGYSMLDERSFVGWWYKFWRAFSFVISNPGQFWGA